MKHQLIFRGTSKLVGLSMLCFTILSLLFVLGYVIIDYRAYVSHYKRTQIHEIDNIQLKANLTINQLRKILRLIESRISAAKGNVTRIKEVLMSLNSIQNIQSTPSIQRISYYKLKSPQMIITRFGILPLNSKSLLTEIELLKKRESLMNVINNDLVDRIPVLDIDGNLEGMLEIQIPLTDFWHFLGNYSTVYLNYDFLQRNKHNLEKGHLFPLQKSPAPTFFAYIAKHYETYKSLGFYLLYSVLLLSISVYLLSIWIYGIYEKRVIMLEENLENVKTRDKQLSEQLEASQRCLDNHTTSCQLRRKIQSKIKIKQIEYANQFIDSLNFYQSAVKDNFPSTIYTEFIDQLETCKQQLLSLAMGLWKPTGVEKADITQIINNISVLFIEKIEASNITLQIKGATQKASSYKGDAIFVELLLINIIGKKVYRAPKHSIIVISISEIKEGILIEIQDNCYGYITKIRFDLFIEDNFLQQLCFENSISYTTLKNKDGDINVTYILLPFLQTKPPKDNVVPLF